MLSSKSTGENIFQRSTEHGRSSTDRRTLSLIDMTANTEFSNCHKRRFGWKINILLIKIRFMSKSTCPKSGKLACSAPAPNVLYLIWVPFQPNYR